MKRFFWPLSLALTSATSLQAQGEIPDLSEYPVQYPGLFHSISGFVCETQFESDSGLYQIDVDFLRSNGKRSARIHAYGDGKTFAVAEVSFLSEMRYFIMTEGYSGRSDGYIGPSEDGLSYFYTAGGETRIVSDNRPDEQGRYLGFASTPHAGGSRTYLVTCIEKQLIAL